jgi:N6-L-threonylcarbamoyladenine synthase
VQDKLKHDPDFLKINMDDVCASIQQRIVTILLNKLKQAANDRNIKHVALAGGVSANGGLRNGFAALGQKEGWTTYVPKFEYCTDNAAMIAAAAVHMYMDNEFASLDATPHVRMPF